MTLTVYHLKTCDSCKKAIKALEMADYDLQLVDVRQDGVPADRLKKIADHVGIKLLLNTRSTSWRNLPDADKQDINDEKALALMGAHPTLIKRPVIIDGDDIHVGWTANTQEHFISGR